MKSIAVLCCAALLSAAQPASAQAASAQSADERGATADPGVATRQVLVRKYFAAIQFDKLMDAMTGAMIQQMTAGFEQNGEMAPDMSAAVGRAVTRSLREIRPALMARYTELYADILTEQELSALVQFYESETGRSITVKSQVLAAQSGAVMQEFVPLVEASAIRRLCAEISCPASTDK